MRTVFLVAVAIIAVGVVAEALLVPIPSEMALNYVEGFAVFDGRAAAAGQNLYADPRTHPFTLHVYTPLYTEGLGALIRAGADGLLAGRLVSYAAILATAFLMGFTGSRRTSFIAWVVAVLYLTQPLIGTWGPTVRPDSLAVLFSALGVVCIDRSTSSRSLVLAAIFFLLALFTKQSVGMGLLAAGIFLLVKAPGRAVLLAALCALGVALTALVLEWTSNGWFLFHAVKANLAPFSWAKVSFLEKHFFLTHWPALLGAFTVLAFCALRRRFSIYAIWFVTAGLATVSVGKTGSDMNHFLEWIAAAGFLVANQWPAPSSTPRRAAIRVAGVGLAAGVLIVGLYNWNLQRERNSWIRPARAQFDAVATRLSSREGPVVSDDAGLLIALERPLLLRPYVMAQLAYAGDWDAEPLVSMFDAREIALVVFEAQPGGPPGAARYTAPMREALLRNYRRIGAYRTHANFEIYAPRDTRREPAVPEQDGVEPGNS